MTKITNNVQKEFTETSEKTNTPHIKLLGAGILLSALTLVQQPTQAQEKKDANKIEETKAQIKTGSFAIDPSYSPMDKVGTVRLSGWSEIAGLHVWWFVDLSWNDMQEWINSAFGRLTVSKSTDKIVKWTALAIEYMLDSQWPDKIRGWVTYCTSLGNGDIWAKLYPVSDTWFDPYAVIFADQKIGKNLQLSSFLNNNISHKKYYGETEASYKLSSNIDALLQARYGGVYWEQFNPSAYVGVRIHF